MTAGLSAAIDRRLRRLLVAWARRRYPALRLIPARWLRLAVAPTAPRLRRSLAHITLSAAMSLSLILALLIF
jgi:hypothetical protein